MDWGAKGYQLQGLVDRGCKRCALGVRVWGIRLGICCSDELRALQILEFRARAKETQRH